MGPMGKWNELIALCQGRFVYIQTHNFPDPDAIASAYGLQKLLEAHGIGSALCYDGRIDKLSASKMLDTFRIRMLPYEELAEQMQESDWIVYVDSQKHAGNVTDFIGNEVACIDHHPTFVPMEYLYEDIRITGACATLIAEYYAQSGLKPDSDTATQAGDSAKTEVETDEDGAIPESLEEQIRAHRPKLIYLIPTFQNPTGRTLSLERRRRIAELVNEYQVPLIEDDPYCDLRYRGKALPAIKSFDEQGYVLYCNSFSKIISPGLRVAAVVCQDDGLLRKLVVGKQSTDVHSPNLNQAIIDKYLRSGLLQEHIRLICASYAKQMDAMQRMLSTFPASVSYTKPDGGIFLWCTLPEDFNTTQLLSTATKQGVAYIPGTHFYADGQGHHNTMRLNFSNASLENIEKGMERLRALFLSQGLC